MHKKLYLIVSLITTILLFSSCMKSEESYVEYYGDAEITKFNVTSAKRTWHVLSSKGEDSTYTKSQTYTDFPFTIDQTQCLIYNTDSLPKGVRTKNVIASISSLRSATVGIKNLDGSGWTLYSSTDSINVSEPRTLRVFADDGITTKDYTLEVRVHNEMEDSVYWNKISMSNICKGMTNLRGYNVNGVAYVVGNKSNGDLAIIRGLEDKAMVECSKTFSSNATFATDGYYRLYVADNGILYVSNDGNSWSEIDVKSKLKPVKFLAADVMEVYGLSADGEILVSFSNGDFWYKDEVLDDMNDFPVSDISTMSVATTTNADVRQMIVVGNGSDGKAKVWTKIVDDDDFTLMQSWMYIPLQDNNKYPAPSGKHLTAFPYYNGLLLAKGADLGDDTPQYGNFYISKDHGITWKTDKRFYWPEGMTMTKDPEFAIIPDNKGYMWIVNNVDDNVWYGKLNQASWQLNK